MHSIWLGTMFYFFRVRTGAAGAAGLGAAGKGRVCQRVLMVIANLLEGMEPQEAGRLCGLSRTAAS